LNIAMAADHAGYPLKQHLVTYLTDKGHTVLDLGVDTDQVPSDYPDAASKVADAVMNGQAERGIIVCGSGVGVSVAANKYPGIYAALIHDTYSAHQGVEHDRMNVICMGARVIGSNLAQEIADAFLAAQVSDEERHGRRFGKVQAIEKEHLK